MRRIEDTGVDYGCDWMFGFTGLCCVWAVGDDRRGVCVYGTEMVDRRRLSDGSLN